MGAAKRKVQPPIRANVKEKQFVYTSFAADYEGKTDKHVLQGTHMQNCDCTGGKLRLMGVLNDCRSPKENVVLNLPRQVELPTALYELNRRDGDTAKRAICMIMKNGDLYTITTSSSWWLPYNVGKNSKGILVYDEQNKQALVFVGEEGVFMYNIDAGQWCTKKQMLPMGCYIKGRLFGATPQGKLVYFSPFNPRFYQETLEDGGEVQLPQELGEIVDIAGVGDCVYVFCEYGIFRLQVMASAREFCITVVPYTGGRIFRDSACATLQNGGEVFFMTTDGLCTVKGEKVVCFGPLGKICVDCKQGTCKSWLVENKYVVEVQELYGEKHRFAVDLETKQAYPFVHYDCMTTCLGGALIVRERSIYYLCMHHGQNNAGSMFFQALLDFGTNKKKLLKRLAFTGYNGALGYVESEYGKRSFYADCGEGGVDIHLQGKVFTLHLENYNNNCLTGMTADVVTLQ